MTKAQTLSKINKALSALDTYYPSIPLDKVFEAVENQGGSVVDEDGSKWSGFLIGDDSHCTFETTLKIFIYLSWYKMGSGNYEIVCYAS